MSRLIDAYTDGELTRREFDPRIKRARQRLANAESKLAELQTETREQATLREALDCLDDFSTTISANLDDADWTTKREILRTLIARVVVEQARIKIIYRINFPHFAKRVSVDGNEKVLHFCWRRGISVVSKRSLEQAGLVPACSRALQASNESHLTQWTAQHSIRTLR